jgi:hypothetical protein
VKLTARGRYASEIDAGNALANLSVDAKRSRRGALLNVVVQEMQLLLFRLEGRETYCEKQQTTGKPTCRSTSLLRFSGREVSASPPSRLASGERKSCPAGKYTGKRRRITAERRWGSGEHTRRLARSRAKNAGILVTACGTDTETERAGDALSECRKSKSSGVSCKDRTLASDTKEQGKIDRYGSGGTFVSGLRMI